MFIERRGAELRSNHAHLHHLCSPCQTQTLRVPLFQRGDWPRTRNLAERQKQALTAALVVTDSQELPTWHGTASKTWVALGVLLRGCTSPVKQNFNPQLADMQCTCGVEARYKRLRGPAVHRPAQLVCTKVHLPCVDMPCGCHLASITRRSADTGPCAGLWVASNRCKRHTVCCW